MWNVYRYYVHWYTMRRGNFQMIGIHAHQMPKWKSRSKFRLFVCWFLNIFLNLFDEQKLDYFTYLLAFYLQASQPYKRNTDRYQLTWRRQQSVTSFGETQWRNSTWGLGVCQHNVVQCKSRSAGIPISFYLNVYLHYIVTLIMIMNVFVDIKRTL